MDTENYRTLLIQQYHSYVDFLHRAGVSFDTLSDEELRSLSATDLSQHVRIVRDLARTPHD